MSMVMLHVIQFDDCEDNKIIEACEEDKLCLVKL